MLKKEKCERKIREIDEELVKIESSINKLENRKKILLEQKENLKDEQNLQASTVLGNLDWDRTDFEWSRSLFDALKNIFGIHTFRPQQLTAINATLAKKHAIVVMPTGAGKSLCYQLPALINNGLTVVVSPLISLMEDQVMSLTKKSISAKLISNYSPKEEMSSALNDLTDKNSTVKLLYVTPERFAKSKRFMAKLQKCYEEGRLQRIAIDEVHCCSQWGHDFRPDYKFLGVLSAMFPDIPILGLTATATSRILMDVQKMLNIGGCLLIKSSFNRPNLYYQIISKPAAAEECINILENLLKNRYKNQSGIIYATSIKDCVDLTEGLRKRELKVACYHANLESEARSKIHMKWMTEDYQAIVATVAFGLGIDKPDVRFVIHHSLSKAMESYYQESGRAGRDGERAECIIMYRMQDIFRVSTMVFASEGSINHLYGMVKYCLDPFACRRKLLAKYFNENWGENDCQKMCDRCCYQNINYKEIFIHNHCMNIYKIINNASQNDVKLTAQKLVDSWFGKGPPNLRVSSINVPNLTRSQAEVVLIYLLLKGYLKEEFHFTSYSTISYIKPGPNANVLNEIKSSEFTMILKNFNELNLITTNDPLPENSNSKKESPVKREKQSTKRTLNKNNDHVKKRKRIFKAIRNKNVMIN